jgi:hypothetical protein
MHIKATKLPEPYRKTVEAERFHHLRRGKQSSGLGDGSARVCCLDHRTGLMEQWLGLSNQNNLIMPIRPQRGNYNRKLHAESAD